MRRLLFQAIICLFVLLPFWGRAKSLSSKLITGLGTDSLGKMELEPQMVMRSFWGGDASGAKNDLLGGFALHFWDEEPGETYSSLGLEAHYFLLNNENAQIRVWQGGLVKSFYFTELLGKRASVWPLLRFHLGGGYGMLYQEEKKEGSEGMAYGGLSLGVAHWIGESFNVKILFGFRADWFESGLIFENSYTLHFGLIY